MYHLCQNYYHLLSTKINILCYDSLKWKFGRNVLTYGIICKKQAKSKYFAIAPRFQVSLQMIVFGKNFGCMHIFFIFGLQKIYSISPPCCTKSASLVFIFPQICQAYRIDAILHHSVMVLIVVTSAGLSYPKNNW